MSSLDNGKYLERLIAKKISKWLSDGKREDVIVRQSMLGRMIECLFGDLSQNPKLPDQWKPLGVWFMKTFIVDTKNRADFRLPAILTQCAHPIWEWWDKLSENGARSGGKKCLLVLLDKTAHSHTLIIGPKERAWLLDELGPIPVPYFELKFPGEKLVELTLFNFDYFLKWADPITLGCPDLTKSNLLV